MTTSEIKRLYLLDGTYFGFLQNGNVFSRDGIYLGWLDGQVVWGQNGEYRGKLTTNGNVSYIVKKSFVLDPIPRAPKAPMAVPTLPAPAANVAPVVPEIGVIDGFSLENGQVI